MIARLARLKRLPSILFLRRRRNILAPGQRSRVHRDARKSSLPTSANRHKKHGYGWRQKQPTRLFPSFGWDSAPCMSPCMWFMIWFMSHSLAVSRILPPTASSCIFMPSWPIFASGLRYKVFVNPFGKFRPNYCTPKSRKSSAATA